MIDLHCHILPSLDDGALDMDDSVAMARQADADGIRTICATPHIRGDHAVDVESLAVRVSALNDVLADARCRVRVRPGGEVSETRLADLTRRELELLTLGAGARWILLEPAPGPLSESLLESLRELHARGLRAIIAHPERHLGDDALGALAKLVEGGALVQVTAAAVAETFGTELLQEMAARGLIHVVGSDAHSSHGGRQVKLSDGLARLAEIPALQEHLEWIARVAPAAIVAGLDPKPPFRAR